ncbi:Hypothetical predicted protein [Paramuricea clavata]|uniref:Uncharacterized protein n=1 Tax=Paramuricea clavata TaxID=317549 RepID=A0A6S7FKX7_PARCT|nr:Hypothetical predicted protein [Paramuricea clavata]
METTFPRGTFKLGTFCFYKDTCGKATKQLVCIRDYVSSNQRIKSFTIKNLNTPGTLLNLEDCNIDLDVVNKTISCWYWSKYATDFESLEYFLQVCKIENDKRAIAIRMIALFGTIYSEYIIKELSALLYGKSYAVELWDDGIMRLSTLKIAS